MKKSKRPSKIATEQIIHVGYAEIQGIMKNGKPVVVKGIVTISKTIGIPYKETWNIEIAPYLKN